MPTAADLVSQGFGGYRGWNDTEANADFKATGGAGKRTTGNSSGSSSPSSTSASAPIDYAALLNQQQAAQKEAIQPAIQSLQAQIPILQKNYSTQIGQKQAEIEPLNQRYQSLIDQIKNQGQTSVNKQTVVTANELGKRGIEGSSSLAGQEIVNATRPIEQQTQSAVQQTGLQQAADVKGIQDAIANLYGQQNQDVGSVNSAIANLQANGGQTAIQQAMSLLGNQQQQQLSREQMAQQAAQQKAANDLTLKQLEAQISQNTIANAISKMNAQANQTSAGAAALNAQTNNNLNNPNSPWYQSSLINHNNLNGNLKSYNYTPQYQTNGDWTIK